MSRVRASLPAPSIKEIAVSKFSDTLNKAYGNVTKEPLPRFEFDFINDQPVFRFAKLNWLKFFRKIIGR